MYKFHNLSKYVFKRGMKEMDVNEKHMYACLAKSIVLESIPAKRGVIRVEDYLQSMSLTSDGGSGSKGRSYTKMFLKYTNGFYVNRVPIN